MKKMINIALWSRGHFDETIYSSDFYYVKLVRKLYDIMCFSELGEDEGKAMCLHFALAATYYFEDIVSGIGMWQTFTSMHKKLYGKYLPFYDLNEEEYYTDEINLEDVCFLLWMLLQKEEEDRFLNPENPYLLRLAQRVYAVLDMEFEKAPMNVEMAERLQSSDYDDFLSVKDMLMRLVNTNYLLQPFQKERRIRVEDELEQLLGKKLDNSSFAYGVNSILACCEKTGPLSLYAKDWLAGMLAHWGMTEESERVAAMEGLRNSVYRLEKYDSQVVCLIDTKGKEYIVPRDSFEELADSVLQHNGSFIGSLVKYDGEWQVNGMSAWTQGVGNFDIYTENLSRRHINPLLYDKLMQVNENHPMLYFKDEEEMWEWFEKHIGKVGEPVYPVQLEGTHFIAVYIDSEDNLFILPNAALWIKDRYNPYYDKKAAEADGIELVVSASMASDKMLHFLIGHDMLPDVRINFMKGPERGKQLFQENMDFIARFMRDSDY